MLKQWVDFNPEGIDLEIEATMWRNMVEEKYFKFGTLEDLSPEF